MAVLEKNLDDSKRLDIRYRADDPFSLSFTLQNADASAYSTTGKSYELLLYTPVVTRFVPTVAGNVLTLSRETMKGLIVDWALREDEDTLIKGKWIGSKDLQQRDVSAETTLTINRTEGNVTVSVTKVGGGTTTTAGITHSQSTAATQWVIVHNLGFRPSVTITDNAGEVMLSNVQHVSLNEVHIFHQIAQAGQAYLT